MGGNSSEVSWLYTESINDKLTLIMVHQKNWKLVNLGVVDKYFG